MSRGVRKMGKFSLSYEEKQELVNEMDDDNAKCPECGKRGFHSVKTMLSHHNQKHTSCEELRRTEVCEACGEEFVPKNWNNPNRFCSHEDCFAKAMRVAFCK